MKTTTTQLKDIPADFIVEHGLQEKTEAKRRPYSTLLRAWGKHEGMIELGEKEAQRLAIQSAKTGPLTNLQQLPTTVYSKYRTGEKAEQLVMIIRAIDERLRNDSNWTYAHVMKVLMDENVIMTNIINRFDQLICMMVPGRSEGTVRKNGNYKMIDSNRPWRNWISNPRDDFREATDRAVCQEIYEMLEPVLM